MSKKVSSREKSLVRKTGRGGLVFSRGGRDGRTSSRGRTWELNSGESERSRKRLGITTGTS